MSQDGVQDALRISMTLGGYRFRGMANTNAIQVVYDEDEMTKVVGNAGLGAWNKNLNEGATITLEVFAVSNDNNALSIMHLANTKTRGLGYPLIVDDGAGGTIQQAEMALIMKWPDVGYSNGVDSRIWTIGTTKMASFIGGITRPEVGTFARAQEIVGNLPPVTPAA